MSSRSDQRDPTGEQRKGCRGSAWTSMPRLRIGLLGGCVQRCNRGSPRFFQILDYSLETKDEAENSNRQQNNYKHHPASFSSPIFFIVVFISSAFRPVGRRRRRASVETGHSPPPVDELDAGSTGLMQSPESWKNTDIKRTNTRTHIFPTPDPVWRKEIASLAHVHRKQHTTSLSLSLTVPWLEYVGVKK